MGARKFLLGGYGIGGTPDRSAFFYKVSPPDITGKVAKSDYCDAVAQSASRIILRHEVTYTDGEKVMFYELAELRTRKDGSSTVGKPLLYTPVIN